MSEPALPRKTSVQNDVVGPRRSQGSLVCADLDLRSNAHPKSTLPDTSEQALSILPPEFPPTFVVSTGNGLQVWWLFREPYLFQNNDDRYAAAALVNRWHTLLRHNAKCHGWTYDRLADLARVLRVPGTTNCKDPSNPKPVVVESLSDRRYNPSELADYLGHLAVSNPEPGAATAQEWAQRSRQAPDHQSISPDVGGTPQPLVGIGPTLQRYLVPPAAGPSRSVAERI
jgi:hypothetical protein